MTERTEAEHAAWRFAVALYDRPDVAPACLALQDEHGVDVCLLLVLAWAGAECGADLAAEELAALAAPWQDEIVRPLRAVRRRLKTGPPAPSDRTQSLRQRLQALEIEAERIAIETLAAATGLRPSGAGNPAAARANLRRYLEQAAVPPEMIDRTCALLVRT
jgi:uncharacterized protein (TIGR02444 family)